MGEIFFWNEVIIVTDNLEKIVQNEAKIAKLDKAINQYTKRRKKLIEENARLTYTSICEKYNSSGRNLIELLERQQTAQPDTDTASNDIEESVEADTDKYSDDEEQICFYDENDDSDSDWNISDNKTYNHK